MGHGRLASVARRGETPRSRKVSMKKMAALIAVAAAVGLAPRW
jgi:hypothetical protein